MNKNKKPKTDEVSSEKVAKSKPDTGQGAAGNLGTEGDFGMDRTSHYENGEKKNAHKDSPIPIKRQPEK